MTVVLNRICSIGMWLQWLSSPALRTCFVATNDRNIVSVIMLSVPLRLRLLMNVIVS